MDISKTKRVSPVVCAKNRKIRLPLLSEGDTEDEIRNNNEWEIITWKDKKEFPTYVCICDAITLEACVLKNNKTGKIIMAGGGCVEKISEKKKRCEIVKTMIGEILREENLVLVRDAEYNEDEYQEQFINLIEHRLSQKIKFWHNNKNQLLKISLELQKYKNKFTDLIMVCNKKINEIEKFEQEKLKKEKIQNDAQQYLKQKQLEKENKNKKSHILEKIIRDKKFVETLTKWRNE